MLIEPPLTPLDLALPFDSPKFNDIDFENLCSELFEEEFGIGFQKYGVKGNSQHGIDLLSEKGSDGYFIAIQCKKVSSFSAADVDKEIKKFKQSTLPIKKLIFAVTCKVTTKTFDAVNSYPADLNISVAIWSGEFLSRKIKQSPDLVMSYFGQHWRNHYFPNLNEFSERKRAERLTEELIKIKRSHSLLATRVRDHDQDFLLTRIELKPDLEGYFKDKEGVAQLHGYCKSPRGFSFRYSIACESTRDSGNLHTTMVSMILSPEDAVDLEAVLIMDLFKPASISTYYSHDVLLTHISGETPLISFLSRDISFRMARNVDYHQLLVLLEDYLNSYSDIGLSARRYRSLKEAGVDVPKFNLLI